MLKLGAIAICVLLLAVSVTLVFDMDQSADAMKAQKKGTRHHHAHYVGGQVCGDEICKDSSPYVRKIR